MIIENNFQFSSVAQSCPTLCNPMDCSMPGLPVHHQLPESTQTQVQRGGDAVQPSHLLSSPSPPALNLFFFFFNFTALQIASTLSISFLFFTFFLGSWKLLIFLLSLQFFLFQVFPDVYLDSFSMYHFHTAFFHLAKIVLDSSISSVAS